MPKKKTEEAKADTNAWMTTYTDLMTLLLTFFVLLLSLSIIDKERKRVALNSLVGAFGFKPGALSIVGEKKGVNITMGSAPMTKEEVSFERLRNIAQRHGLENDVTMVKEGERLILKIRNHLLFKPGSGTLEKDNLSFLSYFSEVIKENPCEIELRGYTGPSETIFEPDPFKASMVLSAKRAFEVYHYLRKYAGVPQEKIVAHGFGNGFNTGPGKMGKSKFNQQVEIILDYRRQVPHRMKQSRKKDYLLDFKGFFFRFPGAESGGE